MFKAFIFMDNLAVFHGIEIALCNVGGMTYEC